MQTFLEKIGGKVIEGLARFIGQQLLIAVRGNGAQCTVTLLIIKRGRNSLQLGLVRGGATSVGSCSCLIGGTMCSSWGRLRG